MTAPSFRLTALDHVQLAAPPGSEDALRAFYAGVLGMTEEPKPPALAARGGCWFRTGTVALHLGIEQNFLPARKAHPGLRVTGLESLAARLAAAGAPVTWDGSVPGVTRFHTEDPVGNRLEFLRESMPVQARAGSSARSTRAQVRVTAREDADRQGQCVPD